MSESKGVESKGRERFQYWKLLTCISHELR